MLISGSNKLIAIIVNHSTNYNAAPITMHDFSFYSCLVVLFLKFLFLSTQYSESNIQVYKFQIVAVLILLYSYTYDLNSLFFFFFTLASFYHLIKLMLLSERQALADMRLENPPFGNHSN